MINYQVILKSFFAFHKQNFEALFLKKSLEAQRIKNLENDNKN